MSFPEQTRHAIRAEYTAALDAGDHARARAIAAEVADDPDLSRDLHTVSLDRLGLGVAA